MSDGARNVLFFVVSIAVLGWFFTRDRKNDHEGPQQPGLLSQLLTKGALPLGKPPVIAGVPSVQYDPQVRPASGTTPALLAARAAVGQNDQLTVTIEQGAPAEYRWILTRSDKIRLVSTAAVTIKVPDDTTKVTFVGEASDDDKQFADEDPRQFDLPLNEGESKQFRVIIGDEPKMTITVIAPRPVTDSSPEPKLTKVTNNAYAQELDEISETRISVYGGYLRMAGKDVSLANLEFAVFAQGADGDGPATFIEHVAPARPITVNGGWKAELSSLYNRERLQGVVNAFLLAVDSSENGHRYSDTSKRLLVNFVASDADTLEVDSAPTVLVGGSRQAPNKAGEYILKGPSFSLKGSTKLASGGPATAPLAKDCRITIKRADQPSDPPLAVTTPDPDGSWEAPLTLPEEGIFALQASAVFGEEPSPAKGVTVRVDTSAPKVNSVFPLEGDLSRIKVVFNEKVTVVGNDFVKAFKLWNQKTQIPIFPLADPAPVFDPTENSFTLAFDVPEGVNFRLEVVGESIQNEVGIAMARPYEQILTRGITDLPIQQQLTPSRGIYGPTGDYVTFPEYTEPRSIIDGFNPSDRVETRVSRLYYFRDAHRVAQIVNRNAESHNRAAVLMQEQMANKARQWADDATRKRQSKERQAVQAAADARRTEKELEQANQEARRYADRATMFSQDRDAATDGDGSEDAEPNAADSMGQAAKAAFRLAENASDHVDTLRDQLKSFRQKEAKYNEQWQDAISAEDRLREEQFRREVAAAHEDPDTYAEGVPCSDDPVQQVSVSVIGEGLIQLRGPIKGINVIRTMINQIDAPVGQVRVSVHTVQINGEKGDRMEKVATRIQRYIDHSRFLTLQSAEMLRKAIVKVAAQQAMQFGGAPGMSQQERDQKYLHAFFGEDFIHELEALDSEFLKTGNKLLAIHSMDSTSLASGLFLMALAKNSTRLQILQEFEQMMSCELPAAEQQYFDAGYTCRCKRMRISRKCEKCERKRFPFLSENARFQSLKGMFNAEVMEDSTMTPIQREFVRLAQIFKSRLIVELELKQRVMERAVIEERLGNRQRDLRRAEAAEREANKALYAVEEQLANAQQTITTTGANVRADFDAVTRDLEQLMHQLDEYRDVADLILLGERDYRQFEASGQVRTKRIAPGTNFEVVYRRIPDGTIVIDATNTKTGIKGLDIFKAAWRLEKRISSELEKYIVLTDEDKTRIRKLIFDISGYDGEPSHLTLKSAQDAAALYKLLDSNCQKLRQRFEQLREKGDRILEALSGEDPDFRHIYQDYVSLREQILRLSTDKKLQKEKEGLFEPVDKAFLCILPKYQELKTKERIAQEVRRPLDHKKFLDMLVDEMEDKYIELLEGTRAHTANIDAYIKRVITSLDDDFNTQFYYPTFRYVREASRAWDVQMGQVETTNVLANNRGFGKVTPEATMEFDLPKRDILILEAMNGAKAAIDDFGALTQDPTFLSLAKLGSGQPLATPGPVDLTGPTVKNVTPAGPSDTDEQILSQHAPANTQFGAALENLIPDPAIYKFETGTGWEIRPVIQPDGQALVFHFNYMYTTNIREPVRADEKHLGRIKRHFVDTDVQLSNFELREISRYTVGLKASRTSRGVPLLEDIPGVGVLFRPLPSDESSLQQNIILGQATIFPTLFDLMGLRWAPAVADLDPLRLSSEEFTVRNRRRQLMNRVFDKSSSEVDKFLRIPEAERRMDLYRSQETIPSIHPNGYQGPGANLIDSHLQEGFSPTQRPQTEFIPGASNEGSRYVPGQVHERLKLNPPGSQGTYRSSGTERRSFPVRSPGLDQPPERSSGPTPAFEPMRAQPADGPGFFDRSMRDERSLQRLPTVVPVRTVSAEVSRPPSSPNKPSAVPADDQRQPSPQQQQQQQQPKQRESFLQRTARRLRRRRAVPVRPAQLRRVKQQTEPK